MAEITLYHNFDNTFPNRIYMHICQKVMSVQLFILVQITKKNQ